MLFKANQALLVESCSGLGVVATNDVADGMGQATQVPLTGIAWNIVIEPVLDDEAEQ